MDKKFLKIDNVTFTASEKKKVNTLRAKSTFISRGQILQGRPERQCSKHDVFSRFHVQCCEMLGRSCYFWDLAVAMAASRRWGQGATEWFL